MPPADDYETPSSGSSALYRFFGDVSDNDRYVGTMDFIQFQQYFQSDGAAFDFDGDGFVGNSDYTQFKLRHNGTLATP